jgi:hypothetical protein
VAEVPVKATEERKGMEWAGLAGLAFLILVVSLLYQIDARRKDAYRHRFELWLELRRQGIPPSNEEQRGWERESEREKKDLDDFIQDMS